MGYLVSSHIVPVERDFTPLNQLPASFGYTIYFHETARVFLIDLYSSRKPPKYPFTSIVPTEELPLDLPLELDVLNKLHQGLRHFDRANGFKRSYVFTSLLLSRWLEADLIAFVTDDDELDFTCVVRGGDVSHMRCQCDDLMITYGPSGVLIQPQLPEDEEDMYLLTDLNGLKAALPFVTVEERTTPMTTDLHSIASNEVAAFTGYGQPILGLGSFDPPEDEAQWRKVLQR